MSSRPRFYSQADGDVHLIRYVTGEAKGHQKHGTQKALRLPQTPAIDLIELGSLGTQQPVRNPNRLPADP